ncbi:MAG: CopG family transcriptional regulator, partial [Rivularia sp. (in: cyanobacteria)]
NLDRVVAYIPPEWKKELEEWGEADERSVSWLVAKLIDKALQERREQKNSVKVVNMR